MKTENLILIGALVLGAYFFYQYMQGNGGGSGSSSSGGGYGYNEATPAGYGTPPPETFGPPKQSPLFTQSRERALGSGKVIIPKAAASQALKGGSITNAPRAQPYGFNFLTSPKKVI
jgi:hypothetical protein